MASGTSRQKVMAQFSPQRFDPYKNFKFRLKWDGRYVAGVSELTVGLSPTAETVMVGKGAGSPRIDKLPGRIKYGPVILRRGITNDPAFRNWVNKVKHFGAAFGENIAGSDPNRVSTLAGVSKVNDVTLKRGVIQDTSLYNWLHKVRHSGAGREVSPQDFRKDIILEVYNEAGLLVHCYIDF